MVGMVEIELDKDTGEVKILDYVAVVDWPELRPIRIGAYSDRGGYRTGNRAYPF